MDVAESSYFSKVKRRLAFQKAAVAATYWPVTSRVIVSHFIDEVLFRHWAFQKRQVDTAVLYDG